MDLQNIFAPVPQNCNYWSIGKWMWCRSTNRRHTQLYTILIVLHNIHGQSIWLDLEYILMSSRRRRVYE